MVPKIILTTSKVHIHYRCDRCGKFHYKAVPILKIRCDNCHTIIDKEVDIDLIDCIMKNLVWLLTDYKEVHLVGRRNQNTVVTTDDNFKASSKQEYQIHSALITLKEKFTKWGVCEVSDIEYTTDTEQQIVCTNCGYCEKCVTCVKCNTVYQPTSAAGKIYYQCPQCKSKQYKQYYIKDIEDGRCPNCNGTKIKYSEFNNSEKHCPKCNSKEISKPNKIPVYKLIIRNHPRYSDNKW